LPSDVLTVAGGDGNGTVTVSDVGESGEVTGLNFATYKPGNNYIAGTSVATTCSTAGKWRCGDDNCKLDVQGVTGRLIYNGATTRNFRVSVNADVTNGSADAKTINFALYKGNTSTEIPTQLATTVTPVWLPATSGAVSPVSFEYIVSIAPNDYLEVWSSTSHASAYTVSYLQTNISPL